MNKTSYILSSMVIPNIINNHINIKTLIPLFFNTYETIFSTQYKNKDGYIQQFITNFIAICQSYETDIQSIIKTYANKINSECLKVIIHYYQECPIMANLKEYIIVILLNSTNATIPLLEKIIYMFDININSCHFGPLIKEINNFTMFIYLYNNTTTFRDYVNQNKYNIYRFISTKNNNLDLLKWLIEYFNLSTLCTDEDREIHLKVCEIAGRKGNLNVFKYLVDKFQVDRTEIIKKGTTIIATIFASVSRKGRLNVLQWMTDNFGLEEQDVRSYNNYAFRLAARNGHVHVLQWMTERFNLTDQDARSLNNYAFREASKNGNLNVLQWMTERFGLDIHDARIKNNKAFRKAAKYNHLHVLKWMTDKFNLTVQDARTDNNYAFRLAVYNGHLHVLQWMTDKFGLNIQDARSENNYAFRHAATRGHVHVLQWMTDKFKLTVQDAKSNNNQAFCSAARNGHMQVLKWMVDRFNLTSHDVETPNYAAYFLAAKKHPHVLQWLNDNFGTLEDTDFRNNPAFTLIMEHTFN